MMKLDDVEKDAVEEIAEAFVQLIKAQEFLLKVIEKHAPKNQPNHVSIL